MLKEFSQYLKDALIIKGRIQVPGLGTFIANYKPADIQEGKIIEPPQLLIEFDEKEISTDDNILNFLVHEISVPKEIASEMLKKFISDIKSSLSSNRSAEISGLGKLKFNSAKKIVFTSTESLYTEELGFKEQKIAPLSKKEQKALTKSKTTSSKKASKKRAKTSSDKPTQRKKKLWPIWLIIILLIVSVPVVSLYLNSKDNNIGFSKVIAENIKSVWNDLSSLTKKLQTAELTGNTNTDSINNLNSNELNNDKNIQDASYDLKNTTPRASQDSTFSKASNSENNLTNKNLKQAPPKEKPKEEHYALSSAGGTKLKAEDIEKGDKLYLIAGSFRNNKNAERLREELISMGYQSIIVKSSDNKLHRVALGRFSSLDEALSVYVKFHNRRPKIAVWLLVKR